MDALDTIGPWMGERPTLVFRGTNQTTGKCPPRFPAPLGAAAAAVPRGERPSPARSSTNRCRRICREAGDRLPRSQTGYAGAAARPPRGVAQHQLRPWRGALRGGLLLGRAAVRAAKRPRLDDPGMARVHIPLLADDVPAGFGHPDPRPRGI